MRMSMKIEGVRKVINDFNKFGREGKREVANITAANAKEIEAQAKRFAPVDTGKLQQSITAEKITLLAWIIEAFESYAVWVEFGTSKMSAQPFLRPAWKRQLRIYRRDLNKALERLGKKYSN